jgi:hypothetical protein
MQLARWLGDKMILLEPCLLGPDLQLRLQKSGGVGLRYFQLFCRLRIVAQTGVSCLGQWFPS